MVFRLDGRRLRLESERFVSTAADFRNNLPAAPGNCGSSCGSDPPCTRAGGQDDGSYKLPQNNNAHANARAQALRRCESMRAKDEVANDTAPSILLKYLHGIGT